MSKKTPNSRPTEYTRLLDSQHESLYGSRESLYRYYRTSEELISTQLFRPNSVVDIKSSAGTQSTYYVMDRDTLVNLDTGQMEPLQSLANQRLVVMQTPDHKLMSLSGVSKASYAAAKQKRREMRFFQKRVMDPQKNNQRIQRIQQRVQDAAHQLHGEAVADLDKLNQVSKLSASSIDFETSYTGKKGDIGTIITGGKTTVSDIVLEAKGKPRNQPVKGRASLSQVPVAETASAAGDLPTRTKIRLERRAKALENIDVSWWQQWAKMEVTPGAGQLPTDALHMSSQMWSAFDHVNAPKGKVGKHIFAFSLQTLTQRRVQMLQSQIRDSENRGFANSNRTNGMRAELTRLRELPDLVDLSLQTSKDPGNMQAREQFHMETYNRFEMLRSDMGNVANTAKRALQEQRTHIINGARRRRSFRAYRLPANAKYGYRVANLNKVYHGGLEDITREQTQVYLTDDVAYTMADQAKKNETLGHFAQMELNQIDREIEKARRESLKYGRKGLREKPASVSADEFNEVLFADNKHKLLKQLRRNMVDMKAMGQVELTNILPQLNKVSVGGANMMREIFKDMNVSPEAIGKTVEALSSDVSDPFLRGYAQESMVTVLNGQYFKGSHISSGDSAVLAAQTLDTFDRGGISSKHYNKYTPIAGPKGLAVTQAVPANQYELSQAFTREMHTKQATHHLLQNLNKDEVVGLLIRDSRSRNTNRTGIGVEMAREAAIRESVDHFYTSASSKFQGKAFDSTHSVFSTVENMIRERSAKLDTHYSAQFKTSMDRMKKYQTKSPGLVNEIMTARNMRGFASLLAVSYFMRQTGREDEGNTISHGSHASMSTVARRLNLTDFNSAMGVAVNAFKMAHKSLANLGNKTLGTLSKSKLDWIDSAWSSIGGRSKDEVVEFFKYQQGLNLAVVKPEVGLARKLGQSEGSGLAIRQSISRTSLGSTAEAELYSKEVGLDRLGALGRKFEQSLTRQLPRRHSLAGTNQQAHQHMSPLSLDHKAYGRGADPGHRVIKMTQDEQRELAIGGWRLPVEGKLNNTPLNEAVSGGHIPVPRDYQFRTLRRQEILKEQIKHERNLTHRWKIDKRIADQEMSFDIHLDKKIRGDAGPVIRSDKNIVPVRKTGGIDVALAYGPSSSETYSHVPIGTSQGLNPKVDIINTKFKPDSTRPIQALRYPNPEKAPSMTAKYNPLLHAKKYKEPTYVGQANFDATKYIEPPIAKPTGTKTMAVTPPIVNPLPNKPVKAGTNMAPTDHHAAWDMSMRSSKGSLYAPTTGNPDHVVAFTVANAANY